MTNIETSAKITEGAAMTAIFNACRANSARAPKAGVTFRALAVGGHEAALRDESGEVVALAHVDEFDC